MIREIVTDPLSAEDLWTDLHLNMALLQEIGIDEVLLLYGFAWGNAIYPGKWVDRVTATAQVESQVVKAEQNKYGRLGDDNLYITIPTSDIRLQYSYECDIHLSYASPDDLVKRIHKRWTANGWFIESKKRNL